MKTNTTALNLTGAYLILAGTLFLSHIFYHKVDAAIKRRLYDTVLSRVAELQNFRAQQTFMVKVDAELFYEHREELLKAMREFKRDRIDRTSLLAALTAAAGVITGLGYMAMGLALLKKAPATGKFVVTGFCLSCAYLSAFMANAFAEIQFLDYVYAELWQMASFLKPHMKNLTYTPLFKSLFNFSVARTAVFAALWIVFYVTVPFYGLLRPRVRSIWQSQRLTHAKNGSILTH